jgi:SHS2 domain-containing protein
MKKYEHFDHTADIGVKVFGRNPAELFSNAGYALFDIITDISKVGPREKRRFSLERDCLEELLVEWLGNFLYIFDTELLVFSRFNVLKINDTSLEAEAEGEFLNEEILSIETAVKAVTYHNLSITEQNGIWEATVILDT